MIRVLLIILLLNHDGSLLLNNTTNLGNTGKKNFTKKTIVSLFYSNSTWNNESQKTSNPVTACRWLRGFPKQRKLCEKKKGYNDVLQKAKYLSVHHCEEQFRYDRWNCSYKKLMFQKIYRETAFMYAISASAMMFSVTKACSSEEIKNCQCAEIPRHKPKADWQWGGCGDNTKKARKIAKKMLFLTQDIDGSSEILNYNMNVGFNAVKKSEVKVCNCHGVSGSCLLKTCWKIIEDFPKIAERLKQEYHSALKINIGNQKNLDIATPPLKSSSKLIYLTQSPNFCNSTSGRYCKDPDNCATLCCGQGYMIKNVTVKKKCDCRWHDKPLFNVTCKTCLVTQDQYICK